VDVKVSHRQKPERQPESKERPGMSVSVCVSCVYVCVLCKGGEYLAENMKGGGQEPQIQNIVWKKNVFLTSLVI
jgi:hypothetical protein